jgi:CubicO group peptidase (beta-lactamase class C family)
MHSFLQQTKSIMIRSIITAAGLFVSTFLLAQPLTSTAIDNLVAKSMKAFDVPGMAVAIVKDGKVIHSKGYGIRSLRGPAKVDEHTLFGIASNSKAFTSAALGILIDEGQLSWDTKVRDVIPEFKLYSPFVTEEFTVRDLLTHRSGLGLGAGDLMFFPDSSDFTLHDVIHNLRYLKAVSSFRTKYDYDNNLYIVAGEVVQRVSGKSWEEFVEQRIFIPLGMTKSAAAFSRLKDKSNIIDAHAPVDGKVRVISRSNADIVNAAGGIYSSIVDLSKWVQLHLSHGMYNGKQQLFSEAVHEDMWSPQTIIPVNGPGPYNTHFRSYGLGFGLSDVKGYKQVTHTGGLPGMVTQITMLPELNLGIIVLTNQQEGGAFSAVTNQIKDGYFGIQGTDRVTEYAGQRTTTVKNTQHLVDSIWNEVNKQMALKKGVDFSDYAGLYKDSWFGEVTISARNDKWWFNSKRSPKLSGQLFYFKGNTFIVKWNDRSLDADAFVTFQLDEQGKASGIKMKAISPLTDFSYDFHDLDLHR